MSKLACGIRSMMAKNAFLRISRQAATSNGLIRQSIFTNARTVHQTANRDKTIVSPSSSNTTISPLTPQMSLKNTIQRGILLFKKIRNETLAIASESSETITTEQLKYMPINTSYRHRWVVWLLIGGNLVVFAMWAFALDQVEKNKDHTLIDLWKKTFTPRWNDLENKDWWKFVRSSFNYTTPGHCMIDSAMLYLFAPPVVAIMGPSAFIGLYLCSGALTSISCLLWQQYSPFDRQEIDLDNLGADGESKACQVLSTIRAKLLPMTCRIQYRLYDSYALTNKTSLSCHLWCDACY